MNEKCWTGGLLNPVIARIHDFTRVDMLEVRCEIQLLNMMFLLKKKNNRFCKESQRLTQTTDRYVFVTNIVHMDVYAKSPYLKGVILWRTLSDYTQAIIDRHAFKNSIKKDRAKL